MEHITIAKLNELDEIVRIDAEVIGDESRRTYIKKAIEEGGCLVAKVNRSIVGFLVYNTHFFECSFISLVVVKPSERRKGYAKSLIKYFENISPTEKIFSSTNQSNERMHRVFLSLGYSKSGFIDNLDEGDPEIIYFKQLKK
ncbi:N-acetyltransferase [Geobacillus thermocatenulatus]|uniref:N-acetyltransferase n=1 Tax=Geobacillus thermocatenulatus TaxID=33938 RepID=A0A226Q398_9BACL|nr:MULTISPECIES: GNAT family N-acetyltransferase [Geobacillus]KPC97112.1 Acetyltransferase (GNAT) family protein [Geobacillus sp. BCO2]RAN29949.1 acetyltransferase [Geobacillus sp. A8]AST00137.1 GNAT family N-acetyltransferase [Geobacillus thermocatenulatus]KLR72367.1 acetyltransferase [Geobacillus sp. T6]OXB86518.1 N-acetyltransferase [Geobacillus thermocatenulatus]